MTTKPNYYLTGSRTGLSHTNAAKAAAERMPAVARPHDGDEWYVAFLTTKPMWPGQGAFHVTDRERATFAKAGGVS